MHVEAEIITIGDEILIGQVVDTNSAWMGKELNTAGITVRQITSISDNENEITRALYQAMERVNIVFITGGLGPTKDDITKHTLAKFFHSSLVIHQPSLDNVIEIFSRSKRPFIDINRKQAEVPDNCTALLNTQGTAPGMWFEKDGKVIVSMPGVPHEMKKMLKSQVLPQIKNRFQLPFIYHHTILTAGIGESFLASLLGPVEEIIPSNIKLAYLPSLGHLRLRLSSMGENKNSLIQETEKVALSIRSLAAKYIVTEEDIPLAQAVLNKIEKMGKTLAIAESCTGGFLAHQITSIPGASALFKGGIVAYSNELKEKILGVNLRLIEKYGAVSEEVARKMALGLIELTGADLVISITGIAGPGGGTEEKPVGLVYIGFGSKEHLHVARIQLGKERMVNIERSAMQALIYLNHFCDDPLAIPLNS